MIRILIMTLVLSVSTSCAGNPKVKSEFRPEQASFVSVRRDHSVEGQAFLRRRDGQVVYAAGSPVALIPKTPYADEVVDIVFKGGYYQPSPPEIDNIDPRFKEVRRKTVANGEGRFRFTGLSTGEYYVIVPVTWDAGNSPQGGLLLRKVSLPRDDGSELVITH